jgi:hypothetical protein
MLFDGDRQCGRCGSGITMLLPSYVAEPLFRHGGYGEASRITSVLCLSCGRSEVVTRESLRPVSMFIH